MKSVLWYINRLTHSPSFSHQPIHLLPPCTFFLAPHPTLPPLSPPLSFPPTINLLLATFILAHHPTLPPPPLSPPLSFPSSNHQLSATFLPAPQPTPPPPPSPPLSFPSTNHLLPATFILAPQPTLPPPQPSPALSFPPTNHQLSATFLPAPQPNPPYHHHNHSAHVTQFPRVLYTWSDLLGDACWTLLVLPVTLVSIPSSPCKNMRCVWRAVVMVGLVLAVVMVCVAGEAVKETLEVDVVDVAPNNYVPPNNYVASSEPSEATGRTLYEWGKSLMSFMGFDYDDDYYYDEDYSYQLYYPQSGHSAQIGYGLPSVGYSASGTGGHQSSYSSYSPLVAAPPQHFHHPARHDNFEDDEGWGFTDIMYNVAMATVPLGLLLTAMPTGLFTLALRRRSLDESNLLEEELDPFQLPLLKALTESDDILALVSPQCQEKLFCELTRIGEYEGSSFMQRAFYYVATLTPDFMARRVGLARLFRASRAGACEMFHCSATSRPTPPPLVVHKSTDTNQITDVAASPEKEAVEVNKKQ
ncbi:hypothetical protein Pcinc_016053 [Petrolisthes cinctipes]|uniref:Uncharacterized protein n=1 Tax=Petrolisthes cinctipes TaxID=88211 RepID=A0AAE1FTL0_PETCI|nr:hypothetical protein Pcinc_016053 [Petrolisthes cinctipes]